MKLIINCLSIFILLLLHLEPTQAQDAYWQQQVNYNMLIDMDVYTHRYHGRQTLLYTNHSPDTLDQVFYHLYLNAFQPGSMMDVRSRTIMDPDPRVGDRIASLRADEIGYQKVSTLTQDGIPVDFVTEGTILQVNLDHPLTPGESTELIMSWDAQIPLQIRRSGRDSKEGIAYSMSQWYPKLCEYDYQGWHANPYIGREFHGVWGDFEVTILIDSSYTVGGTGMLSEEQPIVQGNKKTWHFDAPNVHDFMWAADPDYVHKIDTLPSSGVEIHYYYQPGPRTTENWEQLRKIMPEIFSYVEENYGPYTYSKYSFIQGGDGGMEYPMGTLITGERTLGSLVGVAVHELMHNWYQMLMATNESLYAWMDEGFTSYASTCVMNHLAEKEILGTYKENPFESTYKGYKNLVVSDLEEPLSTHADHFNTNFAYGVGSYTKGQVFLHQLGYIIGKKNLSNTLLQYYDTWKFKHPNVNDFIRVAEKVCGCELDWYKEYWVYSTKWIDYSLDSISSVDGGKTRVSLSRIGQMPMPIDLEVETNTGETQHYTIPLRIMRCTKAWDDEKKYTALPDWPWTHPSYEGIIDIPLHRIKRISIDPTQRMADIRSENNEILTSSSE